MVLILVGSTTFSLSFQAVDGSVWVEHLLTGLPGGQIGFLIVVNLLIFVLAFFLDFFELAFIIVPLVGPVAAKLGIDLTGSACCSRSTCRPRSCTRLSASRSSTCAASRRSTTTTTRSPASGLAKVTTGQIYRGAIPFVLIQVVMVALVSPSRSSSPAASTSRCRSTSTRHFAS